MSEADEILRKVEERKDRARELGVDKLICELYFDHGLRHYTAGMHHEHQRYKIISRAKQLNDDSLQVTINDRDYVLTYTDKWSASVPEFHSGQLELFLGDKTLLALAISAEIDEYGTEHKPFDINAFLEGDWIQDFQQLKLQVLEKEARWERERKEKKAKELKDRFGL